jgi:transcriptional accessory protein Tex/SPT6
VSQMATTFVKDPNDVVQIGQKVKVRVIEIDEMGRVNLSMLFGEDAQKKAEEGRRGGGSNPGGNVGGGVSRPVPQPVTPVEEHPLTKQFRRERAATPGVPPRRGGRPSTSRFRKAHY